MSAARARIHAMFPLDEHAATELDTRLDALVVEALVKAGVQYVDCPVCSAAQPVGGECGACAFNARIAAELAARGKATATAATATPDFFQPGHGYTHRDGTGFLCVAVTNHPQSGERLAMGWHIDSWALHYPATCGINQWNHEYDGVQPPTDPKDGGQ